MKITELIEKLNNHCKEEYIYNTGCIGEELWNELKGYGFKYISTVDTYEHRWYVLAENVYSLEIDNVKYYLGVWEIRTLKSEGMSVEDCCNIIEFFEMEEYTTVSYRAKNK